MQRSGDAQFIHTYTHTYVYIHTHTYIYMYAEGERCAVYRGRLIPSLSTGLCGYVHMYACICIYIYIYIYIYIHIHIHIHTHTYIQVHTHAQPVVCTAFGANATYIHTYIHTSYIHAYKCRMTATHLEPEDALIG